jgi:hypothetical protein
MDQQQQIDKHSVQTWYWSQWIAFFESALTGSATKRNNDSNQFTVNEAANIAFCAMQKLIDLKKL